MAQLHRNASLAVLLAVVGVSSTGQAALTITPTYDATVTGRTDSAAIQSAVNYAIQQFESHFTDPITININVVAGTTGLGNSTTFLQGNNTYTQVRAALIADSKSANDAAVPEPASLVLLLGLSAGALIRRRRTA